MRKIQLGMTVACGLASPDGRSHHAGLDFFAPLFASRQKVERRLIAIGKVYK
ncbi:MAG: hypothetical protein M3352_12365 [Bacteroidota bacterium]|nr:hypothetical protein [Bacteroidota bacterium]